MNKSLVNISTRRLNLKDFDMTKHFYDVEVEKLSDKKFFLKYTDDELKSIIGDDGFFVGAFIDDTLVATCAVDFDESYGEILKKAVFSEKSHCENCVLNNVEQMLNEAKENNSVGSCTKIVDGELSISKQIDEKIKDFRFYEFSGIFVADGYRKMGLASRVCGEVIDYAKKNLSPGVLCSLVQFDNIASASNLKKLGFDWVYRKAYKEYLFDYFVLKV